MDAMMKLEKQNKKHNFELSLLWQQLYQMQFLFQQRNNPSMQSYEDRISYSVFLSILPYLYLHDILKLRLMNRNMKEIITNYLLHNRFDQKKAILRLEVEIQQEKEKLPILYCEILEDLIQKSKDYVQEIIKINYKGVIQMPTYTPLLVMQVAECEGIELFKIIPEELMQMKNYLIFLDFSNYTDQRRNQLLEFYNGKVQLTNQMEQHMNIIDKSELIFSRMARMWLKQTYYKDTYQQFRLIMTLIKKKEILGQLLRQLKMIKKRKAKQREEPE
ncbi:unnamed protein product (macronuclear) [Paramecium tetraurelia]|uniref:F-box domain-containing protein n=1 Tax=Paramecium tetraurelia TaxID=5888 RepID=A0BSP9_PARTE|nr:uncharacterized protein GSPATT00031798001 [Paramecium tetraurelia]CAK61566.1 unnamed protein product [Paramecium tetraurelia]|eukprot:XP_001428964.1 hypothetical protein (macronuclear) [Paramecium tetraurelia strain d4-2]